MDKAGRGRPANNFKRKLCIIVYSVGFMTPQSTWDTLSGCVLPQSPGETETEKLNERKGEREAGKDIQERQRQRTMVRSTGKDRGGDREREGEIERRNTELGKGRERREVRDRKIHRHTEAKKFEDTHTWKSVYTKGVLERKAGKKK